MLWERLQKLWQIEKKEEQNRWEGKGKIKSGKTGQNAKTWFDGMRTKRGKERWQSFFSSFRMAVFLWISVLNAECVNAGTSWMTSGWFAAGGSNHNYDTVGSLLVLQQIRNAPQFITTNQTSHFSCCQQLLCLLRFMVERSSPQGLCHKKLLSRGNWCYYEVSAHTFAYIVARYKAKQKHWCTPVSLTTGRCFHIQKLMSVKAVTDKPNTM